MPGLELVELAVGPTGGGDDRGHCRVADGELEKQLRPAADACFGGPARQGLVLDPGEQAAIVEARLISTATPLSWHSGSSSRAASGALTE
jgi:hypothetical protein